MANLGYSQISTDFPVTTVKSITLDLIQSFIENRTSVDGSIQNGYLIIKTNKSNGNVLVTDLETGIVRDINLDTGFCGAYCFHDELTYATYVLGTSTSKQKKYVNLAAEIKIIGVTIAFYGGIALLVGDGAVTCLEPELIPVTFVAGVEAYSGIIGGSADVIAGCYELYTKPILLKVIQIN